MHLIGSKAKKSGSCVRNVLQFLWLPGLLLLFLAGCTTMPVTQTQIDSGPPNPGESSDDREDVAAYLAPDRKLDRRTLFELLTAEVAGFRGELDESLALYQRVAERTRDAGVAARGTRLAAYLRNTPAVLQLAGIWLQSEPEAIEAHRLISRYLILSGEPEAAVSHMVEIIRLAGITDVTGASYGLHNLQEETRDRLLRAIEMRLADKPLDEKLLFLKAVHLLHGRRPEAAFTIVERLLEARTDTGLLRLKLEVLRAMQRSDLAVRLLRNLSRKRPDEVWWQNELADLLLESGAMEAARLEYEQLLERSPEDGRVLLALGLISMQQHPDRAEDYFARLLQSRQRTTEAHFYLGSIAEARDDPAVALNHYRRVKAGYLVVPALSRVAFILANQQGIEAARGYLEKRRGAYPELTVPLVIVEADLMMEFSIGARTVLSYLKPFTDDHADSVKLLYFRAMVGFETDDLLILEGHLRRVLELDPHHVDALNALGYLLADRTDRYDEAYQLIVRALELRPDDGAFVDSMGWVEYRLRNCDAALAHLRRALELRPGDAEIAAHLGEVLWVLGKRREAGVIWRKALQAAPDSQVLQQAVERWSGGNASSEACK